MGKSKRKKRKKEYEKKSKKVKRMEIIECQEKNDVQENVKESLDDKEQRRTTRVGAIIAIVAAFGTICMVIFRLCLNALNLWAVQGLTYRCLQIVIFATFSVVTILLYRLIVFIVCDLMRYNVSDENCRKYDMESDESYNLFVRDCRIYMVLLAVVLVVTIVILSLNGDEQDRAAGVFLLIAILLFGLGATYFCIKKIGKKILLHIREVVPKVGIWILVGALSFCMALVLLTNDNGVVELKFETNGKIEICNSSTINLDNIVVTIYDESRNIILDECIASENMLYAIERVDVYEEKDGVKIADVMIISTELQHWTYQFDLNDILESEGEYCIFLQIRVGGNNVKLENNFVKGAKGFSYAVNSITKEY